MCVLVWDGRSLRKRERERAGVGGGGGGGSGRDTCVFLSTINRS